ncbi:MAG: hypothetical protein KUG77_01270 [Nannocystaceae bacterium]|nr:hypothetical protein [Nannocystaceae bacterium]
MDLDEYDDDDDDDQGLLSAIVGALIGASEPHEIEGCCVGAQNRLDERRGFLPYPYADTREGYMVRAAPNSKVEDDTRHIVARVGAEGAFLYEDVWRSSAQLRVMAPRFYVQGRYDLMLEGPTPRLDGDIEVAGEVRDRLHFATFELGPQFSPGERLSVRFGVVGNIMFDDQRSLPEDPTMTPGLGGAVAVDLYPIRPLVVSGRGAVMRLGNTVYMEARGTLGVAINRLEIFAGYDHRMVGDVALGGPVVGAAIRF